jgi:hypothetical protein
MAKQSQKNGRRAKRQASKVGDSSQEQLQKLRRENEEALREFRELAKDERFRVRINALLLEGLNSPASEMTDEDWKELKRRVWEVHAKKKSTQRKAQ